MSRAVAYDQFGSYRAIPVGQLSVIPLATVFGARQVAFCAGVIFLMSVVAPSALGSVRRLSSDPVVVDEPAGSVGSGGTGVVVSA